VSSRMSLCGCDMEISLIGVGDEDMTSMHMTMLGESHEGQRDQQGHPNRGGGLKLIRFESPRWRPKSSSSPSRNPGPVCLELVT
jgi:hypothetical protein